jgi:hypothetical protein
LYSALVGDNLIDFPEYERFDLEGFKAHSRHASTNASETRCSMMCIVEQIDYLSKEDIRSNMQWGNLSRKAIRFDRTGLRRRKTG